MITLCIILALKLKKTKRELKKADELLKEHLEFHSECMGNWNKIVKDWQDATEQLQVEQKFWIEKTKGIVSEDDLRALYVERDNLLDDYCKEKGIKKCVHYYNW